MAYAQFAYYYDRLMEDMPYPEWLRFLRQLWDRFGEPGTVADLGCGTGSISIPLARQGISVTGIDIAEDMLAVARSKEEPIARAFGRGGSLAWLLQDIREWELPEPVDCAVSLCDCLNYLTEEADIAAAFRSTYAGLKPGGLFVFDVHTPRQLEAYAAEQPFFLTEEDIAYIWTSEFDRDRCEIEHDLTIFVKESAESGSGGGGSGHSSSERFIRVEERHVQRAYPLDGLERALREAGFTSVEQYADFTWEPPGADSQRAFFVAVK